MWAKFSLNLRMLPIVHTPDDLVQMNVSLN
jgi:hypothetical protein